MDPDELARALQPPINVASIPWEAYAYGPIPVAPLDPNADDQIPVCCLFNGIIVFVKPSHIKAQAHLRAKDSLPLESRSPQSSTMLSEEENSREKMIGGSSSHSYPSATVDQVIEGSEVS